MQNHICHLQYLNANTGIKDSFIMMWILSDLIIWVLAWKGMPRNRRFAATAWQQILNALSLQQPFPAILPFR